MTVNRRMIVHMSEMQTHPTVPEQTIGWRLQMSLRHAGMKAEDMGRELGVSRGTMSRWLNDHGPVREIYLKQWALRSGVPFEWLKTGQIPLDPTYRGSTDRYFAGSAGFEHAWPMPAAA